MPTPRYMGISDFIEGLAGHLADASLRPSYREPLSLRRDVARQVHGFVESQLGPLGVPFYVWQHSRSSPSDLEPVAAFGRDFWPDIAVEVAEIPTIALAVKLIGPGDAGHHSLGSLLGRTLVYTRLYPAVLAFAWDKGPSDDHKHWWDPELRAELNDRYRIKLVIRRQ